MIARRVLKGVAILSLLASSQPGHPAKVTPEEIATAHRWVAAKFQGVAEKLPAEPGLVVLANHDPVHKNQRQGRPLKIGETTYKRGLYCHAVSKIIVRLPSPGKEFSAVIGVDHNEDTNGGRGSVIFSVSAHGREAFRSEVMHGGQSAVPVKVDLNGAQEFTLDIGDAGDGIACDQSDWADASVVLADGRTLWLDELPMIEKLRLTYTTEPPFSFTYGDKPSSELLPTWKVERGSRKLDGVRTERTVTYTDAVTGLMVRCVAVEYADFPTVEWTVYLKNAGKTDTPVIENIQAMDTIFERSSEAEFMLHHHVGSVCQRNDYQPLDTVLPSGAGKHITTSGGRSSNSDFPYFNIDWGGRGVIAVVGWPGQWAADFERDTTVGLRVKAGQESTRLKLHPGEEIRTPLMVLQFWQGDRVRAQNIWRRWMLEHNLPRPHGKTVAPHLAACSSHQFGEMIHADSASQKLFIDRYLEEGVKIDYWWMDAGWYINETGWPHTGTWEVDQKRFPGGLRPITDHGRSKGVKSIVWFEPERVTPKTWLYDKHPEWLLGKDEEQKLLDLGNPEALKWLTDHVDGLINSEGIDLYRNDFNIDPLPYWRANDADDRRGITEIRYVEGFLAYWDELRKRHPNMLIDTCASGGRRNDIETLRRSVPLLRSDYILEPIGQQCHTYGIASWIPFYGSGMNQFDAYSYRSVMCPAMNACYDMRRKDSDYASLRRLTDEWRKIAPYLLGDYYPLTPYSLETDIWMAWQFDRQDLGEGMVQVFKRPESVYESARLRLNGLDPKAQYELRNHDTGKVTTASGRELMETGIAVELKAQPDSAAIVYRRSGP